MNHATATKVANVLLGAAALGAAVVVLRVPVLRKAAWRLAATALTGTIPAWLAGEVRQAWTDSAGPRR